MGAIEQGIAMQAYRQGQPLPDRIANAPQLKLGLALYLEAFFDLDSERSHGMSLTRIPWSAIQNYARANYFDEWQTHMLHHCIKEMDAANLKRLAERNQHGT